MATKKGSGRKPTLPDPTPRTCEHCGQIFTPIRKKWRQRFCGLRCQRAAIGIIPGSSAPVPDRRTTPSTTPPKIAEHTIGPVNPAAFNEWRAKRNAEIAKKTARQRARKMRGRGAGKSYRKFYGRHVHRVIAEEVLGRELLPGEVVHHINGDKLDNRPENLEVLSSQAEHAKVHMLERHKSKKK